MQTWINTIPSDWKLLSIGSVFTERRTKVSDKDFQPLSVTKEGIVPQLEDAAKTDNGEDRKLVVKDDFVINSRSDRQGSSGTSHHDGSVSLISTVLYSKKIDPKFAHHLFRSILFQQEFYKWGRGIVNDLWSTNFTNMKKIQIPVPPLETQKKIANYLDHKVAKIDEAIAKKKQLLQLLEEKRTIVINDTVRDAKGVKTKIKHVAVINPVTRNSFKYSDVVSFVPMEAVSEYGKVELQERKIQDVISGYTYFEENNVVIAKITPCFENGKAAVMKGLTNGFGFGTTEFIVLRAGNKITPQYLYCLIFSSHFRENGTNEMRGTAGQKRLTESYVGHYTFNLPNKEEQEKLVKAIEDSISTIDNAKSKITKSIELLEEYKTSLISNTVTGKVKI